MKPSALKPWPFIPWYYVLWHDILIVAWWSVSQYNILLFTMIFCAVVSLWCSMMHCKCNTIISPAGLYKVMRQAQEINLCQQAISWLLLLRNDIQTDKHKKMSSSPWFNFIFARLTISINWCQNHIIKTPFSYCYGCVDWFLWIWWWRFPGCFDWAEPTSSGTGISKKLNKCNHIQNICMSTKFDNRLHPQHHIQLGCKNFPTSFLGFSPNQLENNWKQ